MLTVCSNSLPALCSGTVPGSVWSQKTELWCSFIEEHLILLELQLTVPHIIIIDWRYNYFMSLIFFFMFFFMSLICKATCLFKFGTLNFPFEFSSSKNLSSVGVFTLGVMLRLIRVTTSIGSIGFVYKFICNRLTN